MKIRSLCTAVLGLMLVSGLSLSQEKTSLESVSEETLLAESSTPQPLPEETTSVGVRESAESMARRRAPSARSARNSGMVTQIFALKYFPAENLRRLIAEVFDVEVNSVLPNNNLIIKATIDQTNDIEALIEKLDVADSQLATSQVPENLIYRVYMFEIPSKDQDMKPFSMILRAPGQISSTELLGWAAAKKIQISDFVISDEQVGEQEVDILIQGKAPSDESVRQITGPGPGQISKLQIRELKWDDEMFTRNIVAAHHSQLPVQMQKHIQKFLGETMVTVGYWFGTSSVPGEIVAPIGPWMLHLELNPESDRTLELRVEVQVPEEMSHFDRQLGREQSDVILSNTIQARVGKPIIVGYNRPSYGTRRMGAMVILPEVDTIQLEEAGSPSAPGSAR